MAATAILFDLDGTLWDSFPLYAAVIAQEDSALRAAILDQLLGGTSIVALKSRSGISDAKFLAGCAKVTLYPGVEEALCHLSRNTIPMAAVTSLPGRFALPMLERTGLRQYFAVTIHAGNCRVPKPHPKSILMALEELAVPPSNEAFYVGDLRTDAEAAKSAGTSFAWASYGYGQTTPPFTKTILNHPKDILGL